MRLRTTPIRKIALEINALSEIQSSIVGDIRIQCKEIRRCVHDTNIVGLHEIVDNERMLLIRRDLQVMGADVWESGGGVVDALGVREVRDVELNDAGVEG